MDFAAAVVQVFTSEPQVSERVLLSGSVVAGAGFAVGADLVLTCAHVLGDVPPTGSVWVRAPQAPGKPVGRGVVIDELWRSASGDVDVAVIRLEKPLTAADPLKLRRVIPAGARLDSFGFPAQAPPDGHAGSGRLHTVIDDQGRAWLQLEQANSLAQGFSGAPLVDHLGLVVGMVTGHPGKNSFARGSNIAYATPSATLLSLLPELAAEETCPYPGLAPYTADQARWFFGREHLAIALKQRIEGSRSVVMLLGPSGSGKSSLAAAGLDEWPDPSRPPRVLRPSLDSDQLAVAVSEHREGLLIIDQFEEVLSAVGSASPELGLQRTRMGEVLRLLHEFCHPRARVLLVMRDDFYAELARQAPDLLKDMEAEALVNIPRILTTAELRDMLTKPAEVQGWRVTDDLQARLIAELTDGNSRQASVTDLPVLALALRSTWAEAVTSTSGPIDAVLTQLHYERTGGLHKVFATWCDQAYEALPPPLELHQAIARRILTSLVNDFDTAAGIPMTRRPVRLYELRQLLDDPEPVHDSRRRTVGRRQSRSSPSPQRPSPTPCYPEQGTIVDAVVEQLRAARVVTLHKRPAPEGESADGAAPDRLVELTHDSLITRWPALVTWLAESRNERAWLGEITRRAEAWAGGHDRSYLLTGTALKEARARRTDITVPASVGGFLSASIHRVRRIRGLVFFVAMFMTVVTLFALIQQQTANEQASVATSNSLAAESRSRAASDPAAASLFALAALDEADTEVSRAAVQRSLDQDLRYYLTRELTGHTDSVGAVVLSPDGRRVATASNDDTARVWDAATGELVATLTGHDGRVHAVVFSPDGRRVATASIDGTGRVWDAATGESVATLTGHTAWVGAVVFSPDGRRVATASNDDTARVWDAATGELVATLTGHTAWVGAVVFSPDGRRVATASNDDTARVWDAATGESVATLTGHDGRVHAVVFSPDGRRVATASNDDTARVWPYENFSPNPLCQRAGRNMALDEWHHYFGSRPYRRHCAEFPPPAGAPPDAPVLNAPSY